MMDKEEMAEWFHNNYEEIALNNGWKTQDDCQVPFHDLPEENKKTMIEVCYRFLNKFSLTESAPKEEEYEIPECPICGSDATGEAHGVYECFTCDNKWAIFSNKD